VYGSGRPRVSHLALPDPNDAREKDREAPYANPDGACAAIGGAAGENDLAIRRERGEAGLEAGLELKWDLECLPGGEPCESP
jgi:hypothetical protein